LKGHGFSRAEELEYESRAVVYQALVDPAK
jgi:hypothetical protein